MEDLAGRLSNRVQLTDIDYSMLVKIYGNEPEGRTGTALQPASDVSVTRSRVIPTQTISARLMFPAPEPHHAHIDATVLLD